MHNALPWVSSTWMNLPLHPYLRRHHSIVYALKDPSVFDSSPGSGEPSRLHIIVVTVIRLGAL